MAIELVGTAFSTAAAAVNLNSLSGGIGSAPQPGDLVVAVHGYAATSDGNASILTAGYTSLTDIYGNDTTDVNSVVGWKVMGSTPDASVSGSSTPSSSSLYAQRTLALVFRGVDPATPMDVTPPAGVGGVNSHIPNPPSITHVTDTALILAIGTYASTNIYTLAAPSGFTLITEGSTDLSRRYGIGVASLQRSSAGAVDPGPMHAAAADAIASWAAFTLALRPLSTTPVEVGNRNVGMFHR